MGDGADEDYLDAVGSDSPRTLVDEVERHLRALLRDVLCGYLDADLRARGRRAAAGPARAVRDQGRVAQSPSLPRSPCRSGHPSRSEPVQLEGQLGLDDAEYWSAPV